MLVCRNVRRHYICIWHLSKACRCLWNGIICAASISLYFVLISFVFIHSLFFHALWLMGRGNVLFLLFHLFISFCYFVCFIWIFKYVCWIFLCKNFLLLKWQQLHGTDLIPVMYFQCFMIIIIVTIITIYYHYHHHYHHHCDDYHYCFVFSVIIN